MYSALRLKFDYHTNIRLKLINLEDYLIIEENNWGDKEWGVCNGVGKNLLGICLMNLRDEYLSLIV